MPRKPINTDRVRLLVDRGYTAPEIARKLAREEGRSMPYNVVSLYAAMRRIGRRFSVAKRPRPARDKLLRALSVVHGGAA